MLVPFPQRVHYKHMAVIAKGTIIFIAICSSFIQNYGAQCIEDTTSCTYNSYKQEIKSLFEDHYCRAFKFDHEMSNACIEYVTRLIDNRPDSTYKACNYFLSRRFKKSVYEDNDWVDLDDVLFADFRLEFVQNTLNNSDFENIIADKINVEFGEHGDYFYVVVGISSTWYDNNPGLWVFEIDNGN